VFSLADENFVPELAERPQAKTKARPPSSPTWFWSATALTIAAAPVLSVLTVYAIALIDQSWFITTFGTAPDSLFFQALFLYVVTLLEAAFLALLASVMLRHRRREVALGGLTGIIFYVLLCGMYWAVALLAPYRYLALGAAVS
jgi:hypothetical protein